MRENGKIRNILYEFFFVRQYNMNIYQMLFLSKSENELGIEIFIFFSLCKYVFIKAVERDVIVYFCNRADRCVCCTWKKLKKKKMEIQSTEESLEKRIVTICWKCWNVNSLIWIDQGYVRSTVEKNLGSIGNQKKNQTQLK